MIFIYALCDPRDGQVNYVGKSKSPNVRFKNHLRGFKWSKTPKNIWLKELADLGLKPVMHLLEQVPEANWQDAERRWIAFYRTQGNRLLNLADGGSGAPGTSPTEETRRKISESVKRDWELHPRQLSPEHKAVFTNRGRKHTDDYRRHMSALMTGRRHSEETKRKISLVKSGVKYGPCSPDRKKKLRLQKLGEKNPQAKLTYAKADEIRSRYSAGGVSLAKLGVEYGVDATQIRRIVKGEAWVC